MFPKHIENVICPICQRHMTEYKQEKGVVSFSCPHCATLVDVHPNYRCYGRETDQLTLNLEVKDVRPS